MFRPVNTKDSAAVEAEARAVYRELFPAGDPEFVSRVFGWARDAFTGSYRDYQAIDAEYHDFEHTLQGTLCMVRLLRGYHRADAAPPITRRLFELGTLAILLHDTGYLKKRADHEGTGAKYTFTHVARSAEFAALLLSEKQIPVEDIRAVQNMIRCTGLNVDLDAIPFDNEAERRIGYALGTSDFLGQMSAADYVDKLQVLFHEFSEAAAACPKRVSPSSQFKDIDDLRRRTPGFWRDYVKVRIGRDFHALYKYLNVPYPDGPNEYIDRVEANLRRLERELKGSSLEA